MKEQSKLIEAIQTSYKEKLVATRDSMHESIKKSEQSIEEKFTLTQNIIIESEKKAAI